MTEIKNIADDKFIIVISHDERFDDLFDEIIFIASVGKT